MEKVLIVKYLNIFIELVILPGSIFTFHWLLYKLTQKLDKLQEMLFKYIQNFYRTQTLNGGLFNTVHENRE